MKTFGKWRLSFKGRDRWNWKLEGCGMVVSEYFRLEVTDSEVRRWWDFVIFGWHWTCSWWHCGEGIKNVVAPEETYDKGYVSTRVEDDSNQVEDERRNP